MEQVKKCSSCNELKPLSSFGKDSRKKFGVRSRCKQCDNIASKTYYSLHREKRLDYAKSFYINYTQCSLDNRFESILKNAIKRKKLNCFVTVEDLHDVWQKQNGLCAYTKLPLTSQAHQFNTVSLDRIDSDKDYTADNIQLVCVPINRMKSDMTEDQFINLCRLVAQNSGVQTPDCTSP